MAVARKAPRARLLVAGAVIVPAGVSSGAYLLADRPPGCAGGDLPVTVAAAPDIAPALAEQAARFNAQVHEIGGRCARVTVRTRDPAEVARAVRDRDAGADAWVPDSSMWRDLVRAEGVTTVTAGTSLAATPVVIAVPPVATARPRAGAAGAGWRLVRRPPPRTSVRALDPARNAAGAATTLAVQAVLGRRAAAAGRPPRVPDTERLFAAFVSAVPPRRTLIVAAEQSVVAHNDAHPRSPAEVVVPKEGTFLLDHPLDVLTTEPVRAQAVDAFRWALRSRQAVDALQRRGFRRPDGRLDADVARRLGLGADPPRSLPRPAPADVAAVLGG